MNGETMPDEPTLSLRRRSASNDAADSMPAGTIKILLIEDNAGDARLVQELLSEVEGQPFQLRWAPTLLQGLQYLSQSDFDVALVDLGLPDSQGMDSFQTIHQHAPELPVVVLTGLESDTLALAAVKNGA